MILPLIKRTIVEILLVWGIYLLYALFPIGMIEFDPSEGFTLNSQLDGLKVLLYLVMVYSIARPFGIFYTLQNNEETRLFLFIHKHKKIKEKRRILAIWFIKLFFISIMVPSCFYWFNQFLVGIYLLIYAEPMGMMDVFNQYLFKMFICLEMFISLLIFSFGYIFESSRLDNQIKSVQPHLIGWVLNLMCYPPFFIFAAYVIEFPNETYTSFGPEWITTIMRFVIIGILIFKLAAIMKLGVKCSNLCNRGIETGGAYSIIRHPHYATKLVVWWLLLIPLVSERPFLALAMIFWTIIYVYRAIYEEKHLEEDTLYKAYMKRVKYRFIPFIF